MTSWCWRRAWTRRQGTRGDDRGGSRSAGRDDAPPDQLRRGRAVHRARPASASSAPSPTPASSASTTSPTCWRAAPSSPRSRSARRWSSPAAGSICRSARWPPSWRASKSCSSIPGLIENADAPDRRRRWRCRSRVGALCGAVQRGHDDARQDRAVHRHARHDGHLPLARHLARAGRLDHHPQ